MKFKKFLSAALAIAMVAAMGVSSFASNIDEASVQEKIQSAINKYDIVNPVDTYSTEDISYSFDNIKISIDASRMTQEEITMLDNMSDYELDEYVANAYNTVLNNLQNAEVIYKESVQSEVSPMSALSQNRYGDVWCGIPNIGSADIRIYYNVCWDDDGFYDASYYDSWVTNGFVAASWSPHYGSAEVRHGSWVVVTSTGTLTYGIPDTILSASFDATFQHDDSQPYPL